MLALGWLASCGLLGAGENGLPKVPALQGAIAIDGAPNEPAWAKALVLQVEAPFEGASLPKDKTEARVLMDAKNLYFAFKCEESLPEGPWINPGTGDKAKQRSVEVLCSDHVTVELGLGRYGAFPYIQIHANAAGRAYLTGTSPTDGSSRWDGYLTPEPSIDAEVRGHHGKGAGPWTLEIKVPLEKVLRYPSEGSPRNIGLNLRRVQWGKARGHKPDVTWKGDLDHHNCDLYFKNMVTWNPINLVKNSAFKGQSKWDFDTIQKTAWNSYGHVTLELATIENKLLPKEPVGPEYRCLPYAFSGPRMEQWDDARVKDVPSHEPEIVAPTYRTESPKAAFAAKPTVSRDGANARIAFSVQAPTDVLVAIVDGAGKVVRHLGAGVLGSRPPAPFKPGVAQEVHWDRKDDYGNALPAGSYRARVAAGLKPAYAGTIADFKNDRRVMGYKFLDLDGFPNPKVDPKSVSNIDHGGGATTQVAIDRRNNEVYLPGNRIFDATSLKFLRELDLMDSLTGLARQGELAFGRDDKVYARGHNEMLRFDRKGEPAPFALTATNYATYFYGGHSNSHRGICTGGPKGEAYIVHGFFPHGNIRTEVSKVAPDGRITGYGLITMDTVAAGVKVDHQGNIYLGCTVRPGDHIISQDLAKLLPESAERAYQWFYGSIVKFSPAGGKLEWESGGKLVASRSGAGEMLPCRLRGAQWVHPGYSPLVNRTGGAGGGPRCACHSPRFELDDFGRLFIPDGIAGRVEVADSNGNTILFFGRRGAELEKLQFRYPEYIVGNDQYCFVVDLILGKAIQVKLGYEATEEVAFSL